MKTNFLPQLQMDLYGAMGDDGASLPMKTAVEWLQELYDNRPAYEEFILDEEFEQAKQMEKEQIIDAYYGKIDGVYGYREAGEEYYNQTFNQK
jgi:hypothetical protein